MLRALIPALKVGARVIISDLVVPPMVPCHCITSDSSGIENPISNDKDFYTLMNSSNFDLIMLEMFNAK